MLLLQNLLPCLSLGFDVLEFPRGIFCGVAVKSLIQLLKFRSPYNFNSLANQRINEQPALRAFNTEPDDIEVGFCGLGRAILDLRQLALSGQRIRNSLESGQIGEMS